MDIHSIDTVENYFLFPTEDSQMSEKGHVEMSMFGSKTLLLPSIKLRLLLANKVYNYYLNNTKINISDLILRGNSIWRVAVHFLLVEYTRLF